MYLEWLGRVVRGDLGASYRYQEPVATLIVERAPVTLALMVPALTLATLAGLVLGLAAADARRGSSIVAGAFAGLHAIPSYVIAQLLVVSFALGLGWFPVQGLEDSRTQTTGVDRLAGMAWHLTLPVLSLAILQSLLLRCWSARGSPRRCVDRTWSRHWQRDSPTPPPSAATRCPTPRPPWSH